MKAFHKGKKKKKDKPTQAIQEGMETRKCKHSFQQYLFNSLGLLMWGDMQANVVLPRGGNDLLGNAEEMLF